MRLRSKTSLITLVVWQCIGLSWAAESLDVEYKAVIKGIGGTVSKEIEESTQTFKLKKRPPATIGQLNRRVEKDLPRIRLILESNGFYDATIKTEINTEEEPYRVSFHITPGEQYRFRAVTIAFTAATNPALQKITTRLRANDPVVASKVLAEQRRIITQLQNSGYPFPALQKRTVKVDRTQQQVDLEMIFNPGVDAVYGSVEVDGLETLKDKYIQRQLTWKVGDEYDAKQLSDFENKLLSTGLFGTARVEPLPSNGETNAIPIQVTVTERDLRTIRVGVGYSDIGPNGKIIWEHRNLFGGGEHLESSLNYSPIEFGGRISITRPGFYRANQSLMYDVEVMRETPEAYDSDTVETGLTLQRDFTPQLMAGTGLRYKHSRVEQLARDETFSHVIFPVFGGIDTRNDKLNPVAGGQLMGRVRYFEDLDGYDSFFKTEAEARLYQMLWKRQRLSIAGRLMLGSINGASVENIPADERFYAGGGGSIRGYEYQMVGPTLNNVPIGGSQVLEFSTELRLQPGDKLGYVAFFDGGTVYNDLEVDADRSLRYGAGLGIRFFTTIGPLRADLAFPLNPAEGMVERLQFYISLGQAF